MCICVKFITQLGLKNIHFTNLKTVIDILHTRILTEGKILYKYNAKIKELGWLTLKE